SAALGQVAEAQRAAGGHRHRGASGPVRAAPKRVGERIPVVEVADHRDGSAGVTPGKREGDADHAVAPELRCLDHGFLRLAYSLAVRFHYAKGKMNSHAVREVMLARIASPGPDGARSAQAPAAPPPTTTRYNRAVLSPADGEWLEALRSFTPE